ncbi:MAG: FAD-dependent oxidoreductase [Thermoleophilia bacterium]|nr:FAD-dependent oxidoreductase [Thermoleophilia bacterium]
MRQRDLPPPSVRPHLPPWWLEEALAAERGEREARPLEGDRRVDVAVVGGGYTGLWTALALRELDPALSVAILEAEVCGWGPSGRNGGFLNGYWTHLSRLRPVFGDAGAVAIARAAAGAVPAVRAFASRRGEDVWLREGGYLKVSAAPAQDSVVDRSVRTAEELGVPEEAVPVSAEEVAERIRSPRFRRGVFFRDGATVQPARLARALRRAVLDEGIALHEGTRVTRLRAGSPSTLETPRGRVLADEVVLAVNAALTGWPPARSRLTNFGSYVVLTEPVPDVIEEIGWTGGEAVTDGRMFVHYFRTTNDGRVLMGSGSGPIGHGGRLDDGRFTTDAPTGARAELGLRRLLPPLADVRIARSWGGPIDVSSDHFPFAGTLPGSRVHYGAGYSGHGVGPSWLLGRSLASLALGRDDEWSRFPLVRTPSARLPPEPVKRIGGGLVRAAILSREEAEEEGGEAPLPVRAAAALPRLLGMPLGTR